MRALYRLTDLEITGVGATVDDVELTGVDVYIRSTQDALHKTSS